MAQKKTDADVRLREARPEDCDAISKMIYELAVYERAPEECHATPEKVREQLFCADPVAHALVAEVNGEMAGYAIYFFNFSTWEAKPGLYLEDVYVRPTFRRLGVGKMFLARLAHIAKRRDCRRFEWMCLDWNKPARDFYSKLGAQGLEEWVLYRMDGTALDNLAKEGEKVPFGAPMEESADAGNEKIDVAAGDLVIVHTDGGAQPNPGVGAWAAVLQTKTGEKELVGGELATTNNRMEMTAAIRALEAVPAGTRVKLFTDSVYLKNGITTWIHGWKRNGWRTKTGAVKNVDLWKRLDGLRQQRDVEWAWLQGHAGHAENERCDELCQKEIARQMGESTGSQRKAAMAEAKAQKLF